MSRQLVCLIFAAIATLVSVNPLSAQNSETPSKLGKSEDQAWMELSFTDRKPFVTLFYGSGMPTRDGISGTIESNMTLGGTLGMEREIPWWRDENIVARSANALYLWYGKPADAQGIVTPKNGDEPALAASSAASMFRFGFADETSFGYSLGKNSNISFVVSPSVLSWTVVTPQAVLVNDSASAQGLRDFEGALRFGDAMRPAVAWRIAEPISVRVGYEWSQIYPRHMFWFWLLSEAIEGIADTGATWFAREIGKSSPAAMPIVYFLLRNGVAAGFKALRMNQMNWPFTTVAPLNVQVWNVGLDVHF